MTEVAAKGSGVRARGRAAIAARTLRTDQWWAYPAATFTVLAAFVAYAAYAAIANRDYYAAPYISPFYSPCLSFHCGAVPGSHGVPHLGWFGTWWIVTPAVIIAHTKQGTGLRSAANQLHGPVQRSHQRPRVSSASMNPHWLTAIR